MGLVSNLLDKIKLKNSSGTVINPATEDKQDDIITAQGLAAKFGITQYNNIAFTYDANANVSTITYTLVAGGTAVLTFTYNAAEDVTNIAKT